MSIFPKITPTAASLVVADLRYDRMAGQIAACGLQGIINRTAAEKLYVHHTYCADNRGGWNDPEAFGLHMAHTADTWLCDVYSDLPQTVLSSSDDPDYPMFLTIFRKYKDAVRGAVVYDPALVQATVTLAVTIAGQKDYLIASPALLERLEALGFDFGEIVDLREQRFPDSPACLAWALEHWFDGAEHKAAFTWSHMTLDAESWGAANFDYVVANRLFAFYLNIFDPHERAHYRDVLLRYPAGTPILGWTDEIVADGLFRSLGMMMIPVISVENLTVSASFPTLDVSDTVPALPEAGAPERDAVYILFQVADGDNLEHSLVYEPYTMKRDPAFGKIPAAWVMNPALCELAPRQLAYNMRLLREHGQEPAAMLSDGSPDPDRYTGFANYCAILRECMKKSGIVVMKQMADAEAFSWNVAPRVLLSGYSGSDPRGIGPYEAHLDGETLHLGVKPLGECDLESVIRGGETPLFLSVFAGTAMGPVASQIAKAAESLRAALPDKKLYFVTPSEAYALFRKV